MTDRRVCPSQSGRLPWETAAVFFPGYVWTFFEGFEMKSRGRKSIAAESTLAVVTDRRPAPPADFNDAQAATWRAVVGTRPHDWFRPDTYALLASYCRHCWHAAEIDLLIASRFRDDSPAEQRAELPELLKARERESRIMLALARSMRITQQAQYRPETAARAHDNAPHGKPWKEQS